jgi:hypothetical protein
VTSDQSLRSAELRFAAHVVNQVVRKTHLGVLGLAVVTNELVLSAVREAVGRPDAIYIGIRNGLTEFVSSLTPLS